MIDYKWAAGSLSFRVLVVPRASRTEIAGEHDGLLRIRIAAPPVAGAANQELITFLAKQFRVSKSDVVIVKGQTGRIKQVVISGVNEEASSQLRFE